MGEVVLGLLALVDDCGCSISLGTSFSEGLFQRTFH